ncbi:MAG: SusC/RagA family TonB-linked outer membrane protein [Paludibacter sp.]|nr:SusC/RagA family TonB-linked outer membrane protein [Paludibacter sp.]
MNRYSFCFKLISAVTFSGLLLSCPVVMSQSKEKESKQIILKGLVRDAHTKKPITAAQISVPNKNLSAVSDEKGQFTLKISSLRDVLNVSAYDYNLREVAIRGKDSVVINLYSNQFSNYFKSIEGLTGVANNSSLVSSAASVDDVSKIPAISVDEVLQSTLGGDIHAVTRSGVAGEGSVLFIRGINSINANAQPLFVVDGVIWNNLYDVQSINKGFFSNPLDNIDVNDIENVTVIKDGTSIYGSKASNGVVIIKTKRAKSMVTKIGLNYFTGMTVRPDAMPVMNGEDFRIYASDLLKSKGVVGNDIFRYDFLGIDPSEKQSYATNHNVTNWGNQVYQTGQTNSYLINAQGGDEKALYYFSLGLTDIKGVVKTTDMQRINFRCNADLKFTNNFNMGVNIGYSRVERTLQDDGVDYYSSPSWVSKIKSPFLNSNSYSYTGQLTTDYARTDSFGIGNPGAIINYSINKLKKYRFNMGILPSFQLAPYLTLSSQFDYSLDKTIERHYIPIFFTPVKLIPEVGYSQNEISSQVMRNTAYFDETRLTFDKKINDYHHLKAILGWRYINNYYESDYAEEHNSGSNNNTTITGNNSFLKVYGINNQTNSLSNYLNTDYDYDNRFFLTGTVAMDASSRFGKETQGGVSLFGRSWGIFPAANGAWLVSSEKFMKHMNAVNFLKIRAGYGITGNDGIKDYQSLAFFTSTNFMDKANGLVLTNLSNPKIQWESTGKANVGADLGLFDNRLSLSVDFFSSNTTNLLVMKNMPDVSGLSFYWDNGGSMTNKGYEVSANLKLFNFKNFKWELGLSVGHYKNMITSLPNGEYSTPVYGGEVLTKVGESVGAFYGYKTNGVFSTTAQASTAYTDPITGTKGYFKIQNIDGSYTNFEAGDAIFVDKNGDGIIDSKDKQVIGNPNPNFYGTFNSKFSYRRFTLNGLFTYSLGNDVYNYQRSQLEAGSDFSNQTTAMLGRWTAEGQVTTQPQATYGDPLGNSRFSDRWIEDGSYIKLKTITLSYDLPIKSTYIEGISFWISANNLFTITHYLGQDPEVTAGNSVYFQGVDNGLTPSTKSFYLGIKLNL